MKRTSQNLFVVILINDMKNIKISKFCKELNANASIQKSSP